MPLMRSRTLVGPDAVPTGIRDKFVTIQSMTASVGTSRAPVETWADLASVWAFKRDVGGRERFTANQVSAPYDSYFELPFSDAWDPDVVDVPKTRRLVYRGRVYDIVSAQKIGRRDGVAIDTLSGGLL
jgi:SPP1 family predicted phage head-tail adaptor